MFRFNAIFLLLAVFTFGVWGCSRSNGPVAEIEKIRALEARNQQLEEDVRAISQIREQLRGKLAIAETAQTRMTGEIESLKTVVKDRELTLKTRTDERDRLRGKVDDVHTKIRDLLNTTETTRSEWARDASVAGLKTDEGTR